MSMETTSLDWARLLKDYTQRNAGRRIRLEIDDPQIGAQWAEVDFPLRGISYDWRDNRVEIMLGEAGSLSQHLTHSIAFPTAVDLVWNGAVNHEVLRIEHGSGQTLLHTV
jgi:hypothetical protein